MTDPTDELDLLYSDVEDDLRGSLRDLLAARCLPGAVIALGDGDRSLVGPLWQSIAVDLGLAGLLVPEEHGGVVASAREAAVVMEELGRAVAEGHADFSGAHGFALDEYVGLPPGHPEGYREVLLREVCGVIGLAPDRL